MGYWGHLVKRQNQTARERPRFVQRMLEMFNSMAIFTVFDASHVLRSIRVTKGTSFSLRRERLQNVPNASHVVSRDSVFNALSI